MSVAAEPLRFGLTSAGCRRRQERLREVCRRGGLPGALVAGRRYVHYFTGYWCREIFSPLAWIECAGDSALCIPLPHEPASPPPVERIIVYESNRAGTLLDDQPGAAFAPLAALLPRGHRAIAAIGPVPAAAWTRPLVPLESELLAMRRSKDQDELSLIAAGIAACEAAYARARELLATGIDELSLWSQMQAAALAVVGETIGEFGNDFQIGAVGSAPRRRPAEAGEIAVLDLSVVVRGYASDMCRSFVVGDHASGEQRAAHEQIIRILDLVEREARPGTSGRALHQAAIDLLDGFQGCEFKHHLGHGVGLSNHEAPRLNVHWDDHLRAGDLFTVEPGLYHPNLRAGIRIEQLYRLGTDGPQRLTTFDTSL